MACSAQMKEDISAKLYDFLEIRWQNYVLLEKPLQKLNHKLRLENQFSKLVYAKLDVRFTKVLSFLHFCMQTILYYDSRYWGECTKSPNILDQLLYANNS